MAHASPGLPARRIFSQPGSLAVSHNWFLLVYLPIDPGYAGCSVVFLFSLHSYRSPGFATSDDFLFHLADEPLPHRDVTSLPDLSPERFKLRLGPAQVFQRI